MYYFKLGDLPSCTHPSRIEAQITYTLKKQYWIEPRWEVYFHQDNYLTQGNALFQHYRELFFGIGNSTQDSSAEEYAYSLVQVHALFQKRLFSRLFAGPVYHFENMFAVKSQSGGLFQHDNLPGGTGSLASGLGAAVTWDSRDLSLTPSRGMYLSLSAVGFGRMVGSDYSFSRVKLDARRYFPFFHHSQILAAQILFYSSFGNVPFRMMPFLGGKELMRGYYSGRYRDKDMVMTQVEYRFPVYRRFGATVFGGAARMASALEELAFNELHYNYGFGIRYMYNTRERINIRLDFGFGKHSNGQYITVGEAF
jgi:outer membrane protein assembly factor BamA